MSEPTEKESDETLNVAPSAENVIDVERVEAKGDTKAGTPSKQPPADPLAEAKAEAGRLKDMWMRTAADFDNFRKRTRRELEDTKKAGREELLRDLLPIFDNLERAIASAMKATDVKGVADGLGMVMKQLEGTLTRAGIAKVKATGSTFDPTVHEAIQQVESAEHPAGTVIAEVQPGYLQGDRLVRAAMVVVSKGPPATATGREAEGRSEEQTPTS